MIKTKYKRILAFAAALIILFAFLTVPASAYGTVIDLADPLDPDSTSYYSTVPVPIEVNAVYTNQNPDGGASMFQLAGNIDPIVSFYDYTHFDYTTIDDRLPTYGNWRGFSMPLGFDLSFLNEDVKDFKLIGSAQFWHSSYKFSLGGDYYENAYLNGFNVFLRDFYIWNFTFDDRIDYQSEISLFFNYEDMEAEVSNVAFTYSYAGDSTVYTTVVSASDLPEYEEGFFGISPLMLGIEDSNAVIYVYECKFSFTGIPTARNATLLDFNAVYVFNPYLDNGSFETGGDDNPALALIPYTTWLGEAVGGFMDFELFNGFTLGGIFMTILAFTCVMWFLKLVAGG